MKERAALGNIREKLKTNKTSYVAQGGESLGSIVLGMLASQKGSTTKENYWNYSVEKDDNALCKTLLEFKGVLKAGDEIFVNSSESSAGETQKVIIHSKAFTEKIIAENAQQNAKRQEEEVIPEEAEVDATVSVTQDDPAKAETPVAVAADATKPEDSQPADKEKKPTPETLAQDLQNMQMGGSTPTTQELQDYFQKYPFDGKIVGNTVSIFTPTNTNGISNWSYINIPITGEKYGVSIGMTNGKIWLVDEKGFGMKNKAGDDIELAELTPTAFEDAKKLIPKEIGKTDSDEASSVIQPEETQEQVPAELKMAEGISSIGAGESVSVSISNIPGTTYINIVNNTGEEIRDLAIDGNRITGEINDGIVMDSDFGFSLVCNDQNFFVENRSLNTKKYFFKGKRTLDDNGAEISINIQKP